jgi:hypothetical protein
MVSVGGESRSAMSTRTVRTSTPRISSERMPESMSGTSVGVVPSAGAGNHASRTVDPLKVASPRPDAVRGAVTPHTVPVPVTRP